MTTTRSFMDQIWTDLNSPTKEEVDSLILAQNIDVAIAKDLLVPTPKQYARTSDGAIYAVLHIPSLKHSHSENTEQEIDFIITEKGLITTRYDSIDALHHFAKKIEVNEILNKEASGHIFFEMVKEIYAFLFDELEYMEDWTREIEKGIFAGREKDMVFTVSGASRNLLNFRRIIDPHKNVWINLIQLGEEKFGKEFAKQAVVLSEEWDRLMLMVRSLADIINELRETNNSILSTKQNEIVKTLTILAFIVFPLATISQIFGMNTKNNPLVGLPYDFWIIVSLMSVMTLAMFAYFKYKRWI